jgi:hypothetical protein
MFALIDWQQKTSQRRAFVAAVPKKAKVTANSGAITTPKTAGKGHAFLGLDLTF